MQQLLAAFGVDWQLLVAQAVNFGIVLVALWYFLYKPVLAMLAKRQRVVAKGVEDAEEAGRMFAGADSEVTKRVAAADEQADAIVSAARESATIEKVRLLKEAEGRAMTVTQGAGGRSVQIP